MLDLRALPERPLVSVVVPSFNQGRFIRATIDSVLEQDYRPLEIIVVDGGSKDDTVSVLESYGDIPELRWTSEPDRGVADAFGLAPVLAGAGVTPQDLAPLAREGDANAFAGRVDWLAGSLDLAALLGEAANACRRISALVGAVKSYSYMDRDARQSVDIHQGIEDTLTILKHRWPAGVAVVRRFDKALPAVTAYGSELNQVWTNLLVNALDALVKSGTVTIETRRDGDYAVVSVADDGPGIPDAIRSRIFDPFFTTKPAGKGTGLGLDIAQRIVVVRHCGSIDVVSRPGETRFDVSIPIVPPDAKAG